jgi:hypothetical protein
MPDVISTPSDDDKDKFFEITPEMEQVIRENWDKISLDDLTRKITGNPKLDGRNREGRAIRDWMIVRGLKVKTARYEKEGPYELTDDQKELIAMNIDKMKPMEMARLLFPDKKLTPLNREFVAIQKHVKVLSPNAIPPHEAVAEGQYEPPKSIYRLIPKINKYISKYQIEEAKLLEVKTLSDKEIKNLKSLLTYMNNHVFISAINVYEKENERELFESRFIRYTYDKPDLFEEEVDQFIAVCDKAVSLYQLKQQIQTLQREINQNLETGKEDNKRVAMSLIELLESYRERETASEKWMDNVIDNLVGTRNKRLQGRQRENASIINLVEAFQGEKTRQELLQVAKEQREAERAAVDKLSNMDQVKALIAGYSKEDAKYA